MIRVWPRRGLFGALVLTLTVTGLTVISTSGAASAAPHNDSPPSVQVGWTDSATPTTPHSAGDGVNLPLGTSVDDAGRSHTSRVYATFDIAQFAGTKIYGGKVFVQEYSANDCAKRAIEVWRTKPVSTTPTWRRPPTELTKLADILTPGSCSNATLSFDVGAAVQDAVAHKQRWVTFEIRVPQQFEADPAYGRQLYWYRSVALSVQHNAVPVIDNTHLFNGGFACSQLRPYPRLGGLANLLEAAGNDADERDQFSVRTEFAIWPKDDATARTVVTQEHGTSGRVSSVNLPAGTLVNGKSYGWQARIGDGADFSAWSKKCFFTYDGTDPSAPTVSSENYPSNGTWAPVGVPAAFTFSGHGDKDVAGFEYSWRDLGTQTCGNSGDAGQLVCQDPFSRPNTIKADVPGGSATVTLNPIGLGIQRLTVRSIDLAGNVSSTAVYETLVPWSEPRVQVESGTPQWGQEVVLKFVPATGVTGVREYEITLDNGQPETRQAEADGSAYYSFIATNVNGPRVSVRSHSDNGFVSPEAQWSIYFDPWPGVASDVYFDPPGGGPVGGVGVEGTFTFSPPPGWTDTTAYRYSFVDGADLAEVRAGADGKATVTWTPEASGGVTLTVYAVRADGTVSDYANWYSFEVAASS